MVVEPCGGGGRGMSGESSHKRIIDVACGSKMFWFDKHNPDVEFCDKRTVEHHEFYPDKVE